MSRRETALKGVWRMLLSVSLRWYSPDQVLVPVALGFDLSPAVLYGRDTPNGYIVNIQSFLFLYNIDS